MEKREGLDRERIYGDDYLKEGQKLFNIDHNIEELNFGNKLKKKSTSKKHGI